MHNRAEVSGSIGEMVNRLEAIKEAIEVGDRDHVLAFFADACRLMESLPPRPQAPAGPRKLGKPSRVLPVRSRRRRILASELGGVH